MRLYIVRDLRLEPMAHSGDMSVIGFPDISRLVMV